MVLINFARWLRMFYSTSRRWEVWPRLSQWFLLGPWPSKLSNK